MKCAEVIASPVEDKLGAATARLYGEVAALVDLATQARARQTRDALAKVGLGVLCGEYHDFRAGQVNPKGDLVEAMRSVPRHPAVDGPRMALVRRVLAQEFADGSEEGARWVARVAPPRRPEIRHEEAAPEPIELTPREYRAFVWLYRYVELYGMAPLIREMAAGLAVPGLGASDLLRALERKGAAVNLGGHRGWLPVRSP